MKSLIIIFILFQNCSFLQAQFYTIGKEPASHKVRKQQDLPNDGKASKNDSSTKVGKSMERHPDKWIQQYLSVSYPLDKLVVNSPYGWRRDPFTGKQKLHNGIDFQARNNEVYAMMEGEVTKVGYDKRSGNYITIRHGNYTVSYCHLSKILVTKNRAVKPSEAIAITGNTGRSTGEHLHLSVKYKGKYINPNILLEFIRKAKEETFTHLTNRNLCHQVTSFSTRA